MKKPYLLSLGVIFLLSLYPLIMGMQILIACLGEGQVNATDYPKYVIPYTPLAMALILSVAVIPLALRFCRRFALPVVSALGTGLFLAFESVFERVTVFSIREGTVDVGSWQTWLCVATPEVTRTIEYRETIGEALATRYSPVFKIHFYLISILILLAVVGVVYGFLKMSRDRNPGRKKPLIVQTAAVSVFVGLCIFACFTAFYRTGDLNISALSSWLMSVFFIMFGLTAGVCCGSLLYFRKPAFSRLIPAAVAAVATLALYIGELVLTGGVLFKFGSGFLFEPVGLCPFAPVDWLVIVLSGVLTYMILFLIRRKG